MKQPTEYRTGRNFIRIGDIVRVRPRPGRRDGFEAKVRAILADERGEVTEIEVFGGPAGRHAIRSTNTRGQHHFWQLAGLGGFINKRRFEAHTWMRDPEGNDFCVVDT